MSKQIEINRNKNSNKTKVGQSHQSTNLPRVAVIGELNVDLVASGLPSAPVLGREILATDFQMVLGSATAIFASGIARLGHSVSFLGKVGDDEFGRFCLEALRTTKISTKNINVTKTARTGVTVSLSTRSDRALVTALGAISELRYQDLDLHALRGHSHLHMTSYFLQTGLRPSFPRILHQAKKFGLTTSFDPNSDPFSSWGKDIWDVVKETDMLFLNEEEALQLTRKKDVRTALAQLARKVRCIVIKRGSEGAMAAVHNELVTVPAFRISPVDTTGAGDSFAAGFIHAFLTNRNLRRCLTVANACGALSAMQIGGTAGQPDASQLMQFLKHYHLKREDTERPFDGVNSLFHSLSGQK